MCGLFGVLVDFPNQEDSEVTLEARLSNDPEIKVRTKLVSF